MRHSVISFPKYNGSSPVSIIGLSKNFSFWTVSLDLDATSFPVSESEIFLLARPQRFRRDHVGSTDCRAERCKDCQESRQQEF